MPQWLITTWQINTKIDKSDSSLSELSESLTSEISNELIEIIFYNLSLEVAWFQLKSAKNLWKHPSSVF